MSGVHSNASLADRIMGGAIAAAAAVSLVMVMHHPVVPHQDMAGLVRGINQQAVNDREVHGALAVMTALLTSGMLWFAARLGLSRRPHVLAGAVAACLALVLTCLAVMLDGYVAPALTERCGAASSSCAGSVGDLLLMGAVQIEYLTRYAIFATAAATALWAADLFFRRGGSKVVGTVGVVSSAIQVWLLFATGRLTPRELALVVVIQGAWYLGVGALMMFRHGPFSDRLRGAPTAGLASA